VKRRLLITAAALAGALSAGLGAYAAAGSMPSMGTSGSIKRPALHGYYDGHKDTFLNTDVSDKTQAQQMHINYAPMLGKVPMADTSEIYLVEGTAAAGQIPVFGSEPGEPTYTPLWHEVMVTWKPGVTPVLLVKDDQIKSLATKGELTITHTHIILNCPIVHPTKASVSKGS
jgi:hypothetical protein